MSSLKGPCLALRIDLVIVGPQEIPRAERNETALSKLEPKSLFCFAFDSGRLTDRMLHGRVEHNHTW